MKNRPGLVFTFLVFFAVVLAEVWLRFTGSVPFSQHRFYFNRFLSVGFQPNLRARFRWDGELKEFLGEESHFSTNAFRVRSNRQTTFGKAPGVLRLAFIGGSTTECAFLDDKVQWPEQVVAALEKKFPETHLEDLNFGFGAADTRDHLATLSQFAVPLQTDVLVLFTGINDMGHWIHADSSPLRQDRRSYVENIAAIKFISLVAHSELLRSFYLTYRGALDWGWTGPKPYFSLGDLIKADRKNMAAKPEIHLAANRRSPPPEYEENLRSLIGIAREHGIPVVLATQPSLFSTQMTEEQKKHYSFMVHYARVVPEEWGALLAQFNEVTRKIARESGTYLADLEKLIPKKTELFYDDHHAGIEGSRRFAEAFLPAVEQAVRARLKKIR